MPVLVVAEKPSAAGEIAKVVGGMKRQSGYWSGNHYWITWAIGHLVGLAAPHQVDQKWKQWHLDQLPILPKDWPLIVLEKTADHYDIVKGLLLSRKVTSVVAATDAGREGELIFRYLYQKSGCRKPVKRLWISSLTKEAIATGLRNLRPSDEFDHLAQEAQVRAKADWLVGINLSRTYSLLLNEQYSVGRVQTPTLAMIVEREQAINDFKIEEYLEVHGTFCLRNKETVQEEKNFPGILVEKTKKGKWISKRFSMDGVSANLSIKQGKRASFRVGSCENKKIDLPPPLFHDLTELQRHANRLYGFKAEETLRYAQDLYEKKMITYPRTDCRYLSTTVANAGKTIAVACGVFYQEVLVGIDLNKPLSSRFIKDSAVTEHHAIIPTGMGVAQQGISANARKIFDLVCRRFLAAWFPSWVRAVTTVLIEIEIVDDVLNRQKVLEEERYQSHGKRLIQKGWRLIDGIGDKSLGKEYLLPENIAEGQFLQLKEIKSVPKKTEPPSRLTDSTLLTAMQSAGKTFERAQLSGAMIKKGLGTAATRAGIIETLVSRGFVVREKKHFRPTAKGMRLVSAVDSRVKSPNLTGGWEERLARVGKGQETAESYQRDIEAFISEIVAREKMKKGHPGDVKKPQEMISLEKDTHQSCIPTIEDHFQSMRDGEMAKSKFCRENTDGNIDTVLRERFGHPGFRPHQRDICEKMIAGRDGLLVMPTGAGKSLCYQIPGFVRQGTTIVISPLIALIDDQVTSLQQIGMKAAGIHSGMTRQESRDVCLSVKNQQLDFLFIAPERLGVDGFLTFLARQKISLIAVDEAHCISQWGHDFRPDYRKLHERLPALRPSPILAMTATATPVVQRDIISQLGLENPELQIHGFKRDNIAIEVVGCAPSKREQKLINYLQDESRRPAIVYTNKRALAEEIAASLQSVCQCEPYHAGLSSAQRRGVQSRFLGGTTPVVVATIAFGMGIDKSNIRSVIHMALPGSLEGFYQEIGRSGRDGELARSVLFFSEVDKNIHDFFHKKNYPELEELTRVLEVLSPKKGMSNSDLGKLCGRNEELSLILERLIALKAIEKDDAGQYHLSQTDWTDLYLRQKRHHQEQIQYMQDFAQDTIGCRMVNLVKYFGEVTTPLDRCGKCDNCARHECQVKHYRGEQSKDRERLETIFQFLHQQKRALPLGTVYRHINGKKPISRPYFFDLIGALHHRSFVSVERFPSGPGKQYYRVALATKETTLGSRLPFLIGATGGGGVKKKEAPRSKPAQLRRSMLSQSSEEQAVSALKAWRLRRAKKENKRAFQIMSNRTLSLIAKKLPRDDSSLLAIKGIGPKKHSAYGREILVIIDGLV